MGNGVTVEGVGVSLGSLHVGVDVVGGPVKSIQLGRLQVGKLYCG